MLRRSVSGCLKIPKMSAGQGMTRNAVLTSALALVVSIIQISDARAGAAARGFVCGVSNGAPSTNAVKADGDQVPVIRWTSTTFEASGWSPERRCQEVSGRFDTYLKQGRLAFITTGRINGLPVICTAASNGGPCDRLLYTLMPGQNATATLRDLYEIRVKARGPLNETTSRLYVSLDELIKNAEGNSDDAYAPAQTVSTSQSNDVLW